MGLVRPILQAPTTDVEFLDVPGETGLGRMTAFRPSHNLDRVCCRTLSLWKDRR
jgi:hypothetical protein